MRDRIRRNDSCELRCPNLRLRIVGLYFGLRFEWLSLATAEERMFRSSIFLGIAYGVIVTLRLSAEPSNRAEIWMSWSPELRVAYINGYEAGLQRAAGEVGVRLLGKKAFEDVRLRPIFKAYIFRAFELSQIASVMTNLYADPANAYVPVGDMVLIARSRLAGESIDDALTKARKLAADWNAFLERN